MAELPKPAGPRARRPYVTAFMIFVMLALWSSAVVFNDGVVRLMFFWLGVMVVVATVCWGIAYYFDFVRKAAIPVANALGGGVKLREYGPQPADWPLRLAAILAFIQWACVCAIERLKEATVPQDVDTLKNRVKQQDDADAATRKEQAARIVALEKAHSAELETLRGKIKELTERPAPSPDAVANLEIMRKRHAELEQKCRDLEQQGQEPATTADRCFVCKKELRDFTTYQPRHLVTINDAGRKRPSGPVVVCKGRCRKDVQAYDEEQAAPQKPPESQTKKPVPAGSGT